MTRTALLSLLVAAAAACAGPAKDASGLTGTSWQLVRFQGGDGATVRPDDRSKYTIAFEEDGILSARIDCNRARGSWKWDQPNRLEFGPLAITRAACPADSLHDRIIRHLPYLTSYLIKDGRLIISLLGDGGVYEFEPVRH